MAMLYKGFNIECRRVLSGWLARISNAEGGTVTFSDRMKAEVDTPIIMSMEQARQFAMDWIDLGTVRLWEA
jgi:hypothetical protein